MMATYHMAYWKLKDLKKLKQLLDAVVIKFYPDIGYTFINQVQAEFTGFKKMTFSKKKEESNPIKVQILTK